VRWSGDVSTLAMSAASGGLRLARYDASGHTWTEETFVLDDNGSAQSVWFALRSNVAPGGDDTSYWFYSGDTMDPPPHGVPADVFPDLYVNFAAGLSGFVSLGTPMISPGGVSLPMGATSVRSSSTFTPGHAVDFAMAEPAALGVGSAGWLGGGFQRSSDFDDSEPWLLWLTRTPGQIQDEAQLDAVGESEMVGASSVGATQEIFGVERYDDHAIYLRADAHVVTLGPWPGGAFTSPLQVRFMNTDNTNQGDIEIAWARVRRCVDPAPSVSVGPVETHP
jgi:hypothetical protein